MSLQKYDTRLSQIVTDWDDLWEAHRGPGEVTGEAQRRLLMRYSPAVYGYLLGAVHDPDVADDLFQEFALRLVRGAFGRADPARGRFRDFLRTALIHLVTDHHRRAGKMHLPLTADVADRVPPVADPEEAERQFLAHWRARLIDGAWSALEDFERRIGQPLYSILHLRAEQPELSAAQLAERLAPKLGRPLTAEWVHKRLHQARKKFTDLLVEEVARSLEDPSTERLAEELAELDLLERCRAALGRRTLACHSQG